MIANAGFGKLREQAIALRRAGKSRREIKEQLAIGSLRLEVRRSAGLYREIEGWATAAMATGGQRRSRPADGLTACGAMNNEQLPDGD